MPVHVAIQLHGLAEAQAKLRPALMLDPTKRLLHAAAAYATREASQNAPRDTGATAISLTPIVRGMHAAIGGSNFRATMTTELGRHTFKKAPPSSALRGWAARHGMPGLEFVLARSIGERGTKGRFFMRRAKEKLHQYELPRLLAKAGDEIKREWLR